MGNSGIKAVARNVTFELFAKGDLKRLEDLTAPDFINHGQTGGDPNEGRENLKNAITRVRAAFPDLTYTLEHEMVEGELVLHHVTARGTHTGPILGHAPTGKQAVWAEMHLMRFSGGKMTEQWGVVDRLGLLQQLGFGPGAPPKPGN
jgi:predicted ester cyclase